MCSRATYITIIIKQFQFQKSTLDRIEPKERNILYHQNIQSLNSFSKKKINTFPNYGCCEIKRNHPVYMFICIFIQK